MLRWKIAGVAGLLFVAILVADITSGAAKRKQVKMIASRPECGVELIYKSVNENMPQFSGIYREHAEEFMLDGKPAYQIIRTSDKMLARATISKADLSPIAIDVLFHDDSFRIQRRYGTHKVRIYRHEEGEKDIDVTTKIKPGVVDPSLLGFRLQGYPFGELNSFSELRVLSSRFGGRSVRMDIMFMGEERVKVRAGEFDCYRLDVAPPSVIRHLVKPGKVWYVKTKPHRFIKLEAKGGKDSLELLAGPIPCDQGTRCTVHAEPPGPIRKVATEQQKTVSP